MSELAKIETITAIQVFSEGGAERLISAIEAEVSSLVFDVTTAKGRAEIKSMAYKVAQSKTALDALGKDLVSDWKKKSALVDSERKMIRDRLDALKEKVRAPLTEWENAEAARIAKEELEKEIAAAHEQAIKDNEIFDRIKELERKEAALKAIEDARIAAKLAEKERIEKEEREKRIAEEAEKRAIEQERQRAAAEAERQARLVAEAKAAEERAKREKEEALKLAEERRIKELAEAAEAAKIDAEKKEAERIRKEEEIRLEEKRRAENKAHQKNINQKVMAAMVVNGLSERQAKDIIVAIVKGDVPFVSINY